MPAWPSSTSWPSKSSWPGGASWPGSTSWPGGSAPVSPLTIIDAASVVAAYDAGVVALNGSNVAGLPDQSPNGWNGIQGTAGFQPLWSASDAAYGGRPSITFDGVDDILDFSLPIPSPGTTPRYYYWFGRQLGWTAGRVLFGGNGGLCQLVFQTGTTPRLAQYNGSSGALAANSPIGTARRDTAIFSNAASDQLILGSIGSVPAIAGNNSSVDWHIGGGGAAGQFANWSFSYILIMNRQATAPEIGALDAWALSVGYPATIFA